MAQAVKNLPAIQETRVRSLGWKDSLEKGIATHSGILAWEIHGQRSLVDCSPQGHRARHSLVTKQQHIAEKYFSCYWIKREMSDQNS